MADPSQIKLAEPSEEPTFCPADTGDSIAIRWPHAIGIALLCLICSLARHVPFASDGYVGMEGLLTMGFQETFAQNWLEKGFIQSYGKPVVSPQLNSKIKKRIYSNHPPLAHWLIFIGVKTFGDGPLGFRSMPILATALTAFLLALFATRKSGIWAGLAAGLIYCSLPMTFVYGRHANFEVFVTLFGLGATIVSLAAKSRWGFALSVLLWFLTGFIDWVALFVAVSFFCFQFASHQKLRFQAKYAIYAVVVSFCAYALLLTFWVGSPFAMVTEISQAATLGTKAPARDWGEFFVQQRGFWIRLFSESGIFLALAGTLVGLIQVCRRKCSPLLVLAMTWAIGSLINVVAFLERSKNHEFWWYYLSPAIALFGALFVSWAAQKKRVLGVLSLIVILFFTVRGTVLAHQEIAQLSRNRDWLAPEEIDFRFGAETMVLDVFKGKVRPKILSRKCDYRVIRDNLEEVHFVIGQFHKGLIDKKRLVVWYAADLDERLKVQLQWFLFHGAKHETDGKSSLLIFERE